jgi:hypothetical protein
MGLVSPCPVNLDMIVKNRLPMRYLFGLSLLLNTVRAEPSVVSNVFVLDTQIPVSTVDSNVFVMDSRPGWGSKSGSVASGNFVLDTGTSGNTPFWVEGPSTIASGEFVPYRCFMQHSSGQVVEVTFTSALSFVESLNSLPAGTGIGGMSLLAGDVIQPYSLNIRAIVRRPDAQVASAPFEVTIVPKPLTASASGGATLTGTNTYQVTLESSASGGVAPYTFTWDTNGDGTFGDLNGANSSLTETSTGGSKSYVVKVTDGLGATTTANAIVQFFKPLAPDQPERPEPPPRNDPPSMLDADSVSCGNQTGSEDLDPAKKDNGLIVVTHGMRETTSPELPNWWLRNLATAICGDLSVNPPNVVYYNWAYDSSPTESERLSMKVKVFVLRQAMRAAVRAAVTSVSHGTVPQLAINLIIEEIESGIYDEVLIDALLIRGVARDVHGKLLAEWVNQEVIAGNINPHSPIHMIGHSAGGFVVGEAAYVLGRQPSPIIVDRVTMLDTPEPWAAHTVALPGETSSRSLK